MARDHFSARLISDQLAPSEVQGPSPWWRFGGKAPENWERLSARAIHRCTKRQILTCQGPPSYA